MTCDEIDKFLLEREAELLVKVEEAETSLPKLQAQLEWVRQQRARRAEEKRRASPDTPTEESEGKGR